MAQNPINILVLCTGNSARSIMAEAYLNHAGQGKVKAYSAGSRPTGQPHPLALATLEKNNIEVTDARSKSWDEFEEDDAPKMDLVITVCDNAAKETCPVWPGAPKTYHWPFPDPAAATGGTADQTKIFEMVFADIKDKIDGYLARAI